MAARKTMQNVGRRRPNHVGTRLFTGEGEKAIVAFPLFRGEVLERTAIDAFGITKDDEENLDQPPIFEWIGIVAPTNFGSTTITTALLDGQVLTAFAPASGEYIGGEPNPGGNISWGNVRFGSVRQIFRRTVIGDPIPTGKDVLLNSDARFMDRFRTVINRDFEAETDSLVIFGSRLARTDAQTDFGVAEMDAGSDDAIRMRAYVDPLGITDHAVSGQKTIELLYGGDNYIEADSFKESQRRMYMLARPQIRRSSEIISRWT